MLLGRSMLIAGAALQGWAFNPADNFTMTLSNGNRTAAGTGTAGVRGNRVMATGKHYFEVLVTSTDALGGVGITDAAGGPGGPLGNVGDSLGWRATGGEVWHLGVLVASYATVAGGDVVGVAVDMGARKVWFAKNNVWQGGSDPAAGTSGLSFGSGDHYVQAVGGTFTITYPRRYFPPAGFTTL